MHRIGWIGLGRIGLPIAKALVADGFHLAAYDIAEEACREVSGPRSRIGWSVADATEDAEAVIICVTDGVEVEQVMFGAEGAASVHGGGRSSSMTLQYIQSRPACLHIVPANLERFGSMPQSRADRKA